MKESKLTAFAVGYSFAFFYGLCFLASLFKRWIKDPSGRFLNTKDHSTPPHCLTNLALGNHAYVQIEGVKIHYVENGERSKPLMLCLHGFPEFWYSWRHQLTEFSSDFWVVAVDMRGYGDSDKPAGQHDYKVDLLVADVKNLIIALGREKCTLVAHDWGGIIAWYFVLLHPHMLDSYVIMNSAHPIAFLNVINKSQEQFKRSWYLYFFQLPFLPELSCRMDDMRLLDTALQAGKTSAFITDEDLEAYKYTFGKHGAFTCPINYYRANFMLGSSRQLQDLGNNKDLPPGLLLFGDADPYLEPVLQEESARLVYNTQVEYLHGAGHFLQQDDPAVVNQLIKTFFSRLKAKE